MNERDPLWCCERRTAIGGLIRGRPQILVDHLLRFGIVECDLCGKTFGHTLKLVRRRKQDPGEE
jgi:hypothetical protein